MLYFFVDTSFDLIVTKHCPSIEKGTKQYDDMHDIIYGTTNANLRVSSEDRKFATS